MCNTCGCAMKPADTVTIDVLQGLLAANDRAAAHNREHFDRHRVLVVNLMSSPGAGKTALLEATIVALRERYRIAVIEGDLETDNDAARIRAHGVPALQITTGSACHLDAQLVHAALHELPLAGLDLLFIENVGNLVCPAGYDLGEALRVAIVSVTEGEDKPLKYPAMFHSADVVAISKIDLAAACEFDRDAALRNIREIRPGVEILETSSKSGAGFAEWFELLARRREAADEAEA